MVKDILTTIAMVDICIYNGHPLNPILMTEVSYHDSFCINGTKASNAVNHFHCVVPWWPHQGKGSFNLSLHNRFCRSNSTTCGDPMSICYPGGQIRGTHMHTGYLRIRSHKRIIFTDTRQVKDSLLQELVPSIEEPFLPLWMSWRNLPIKGWEKD